MHPVFQKCTSDLQHRSTSAPCRPSVFRTDSLTRILPSPLYEGALLLLSEQTQAHQWPLVCGLQLLVMKGWAVAPEALSGELCRSGV